MNEEQKRELEIEGNLGELGRVFPEAGPKSAKPVENIAAFMNSIEKLSEAHEALANLSKIIQSGPSTAGSAVEEAPIYYAYHPCSVVDILGSTPSAIDDLSERIRNETENIRDMLSL